MEIPRNIARGAAAVGLAALIAIPVIAQAEESLNANATLNANVSTNAAVNAAINVNGRIERPRNEREQEKKAKNAVDAACMKAAVTKRDDAVSAAWDTLSASVKTALSSRKTALLAAWDLSDAKSRRNAQNAAWKAYAASVRDARKTFRTSQRATWKQFKIERTACHGNAEDRSEEGMDAAL